MKLVAAAFLLLFMSKSTFAQSPLPENQKEVSLIALSQQLLLQAKTHDTTESLVQQLKSIPEVAYTSQLTNDNLKKTFWINIYNSFTQVILAKNPNKYKERSAFFTDKQIELADRLLSLDDIEHGILRHSKIKWSLGHVNKLFPSGFEKKHRVDTLDYRIHFSLNCGAKSCPPIAFYRPEQLDQQLTTATKVYLEGEAEYQDSTNSVAVPALMGWFRGDFGGKKGIIKLLQQLKIVPEGKKPAITFKKYDWNLFLANYTTE